MLNLRGHVDQYIPIFINLAMTVLNNDEVKTKSYRIHLMEMAINAIYYNPLLALQVLESNEWTNKFFSTWFSSMDIFKRVHDKKLSIVAISSLLTLRASDVPASVQPGWPRLLQGVTGLFQTLPAAMKRAFSPSLQSTIHRYTEHPQNEKMPRKNLISLLTRITTGMRKWNGMTEMRRKVEMEMWLMRVPHILNF
jgi:hypothetical protein